MKFSSRSLVKPLPRQVGLLISKENGIILF